MGSEEIGSIPDKVEDLSICSGSMTFKPPSEVDLFYNCGWDPNFLGNSGLVHQNEFADPHYPVISENQTMGNSSHLVPFTSGSSLVDVVGKNPTSGIGTFSRMVCHENFQNSEDKALGSLPNAKRKREIVEVDQQNNQNVDTCGFPKEDEPKKMGPNSRSKQAAKQTKANSNDAEPSKENYILVRAKRGQATNSHSLAERLRREKISERMKLLQELVPGCNKITGKAVMLDEIINYVQSLQQQVEFLSMKLATVNPELNVDIERFLTKDLLHPQAGLGPGLGPSHTFTGLHNGTINSYQGIVPSFHPLPPNLWNNDLQSILQTGFDSNPSLGRLGANGLSKMDL